MLLRLVSRNSSGETRYDVSDLIGALLHFREAPRLDLPGLDLGHQLHVDVLAGDAKQPAQTSGHNKTPPEKLVSIGKKILCGAQLSGVVMDPAGSHVQRDIFEKLGVSELWTPITLTSSQQISRRRVTACRH